MDHAGLDPSRSSRQPPGSQWVVSATEAGCRLDAFLAVRERLRSRGRAKRAIERGQVQLNEEEALPEHAATRLSPGDRVRAWTDRPGSARVRRRPSRDTHRELAIVYEDASVLVVNKPAGLLTVQLARRPGAPSAASLLASYLRSQGKRRAWVVHRIDRDTSGLVVFATNPSAREALKNQFARREPERVYLALVRGTPDPPAGVWRDQLRWDAASLAQTVTDARDSRAREAVTNYRVLESFGSEAAFVCLRLHTGRRNQIRIQASAHGHPLLGERMYVSPVGFRRGNGAATRQALHAWRLRFLHPDTGRPISVEAPLPADLRLSLSELRKPARGIRVENLRKCGDF
ncbi:MAG: RluA family pseudouridine synthase [Acidimicrobiia bacterium]|nr:RluA family pseudouridine synthase [Acidimicrobiia bacterium]